MSEYRLYRVLRNAEGKHVGNEYMGILVTCKECKHWASDGAFTLNELGEEEQLCKWWSKFGTIRTAETAFCSYGERTEQIIKMPKADGSTIPKDYLRGESDE